MRSLCLYCGAEGPDGRLPAGHEYGQGCPERPEAPCPTCGAGAVTGAPCVITGGPRAGEPTRPHRDRIAPVGPMDVLAPRSVENVVALAARRR